MRLFARDLMRKHFEALHVDSLCSEALKKMFEARIDPSEHKSLSLMVIDDDSTLVETIGMYHILYHHLRPLFPELRH